MQVHIEFEPLVADQSYTSEIEVHLGNATEPADIVLTVGMWSEEDDAVQAAEEIKEWLEANLRPEALAHIKVCIY